MNQQLIGNKASVQQFIMKSIVAGVTILLIYYLTIATFIARTISFMDTVDQVLVVSAKAGFMDKVEQVLVVSAKRVLNQDYIAEQVKIQAHQLLNGGQYTHALIHYYEKLADRVENISGENKNRLRESTSKILNNLQDVLNAG